MFEEEEEAITLRSENKELRAALERQVEEFLARGGTIEQAEIGRCKDVNPLTVRPGSV